ncbi:MAG: hypothetical protein Kow0098_19890 [Ignavibacteriaceae bacterium]
MNRYLKVVLLSAIIIFAGAKKLNAQNPVSIGLNIGGGSLSGNSPSQAGYSFSLFLESDFELIPSVLPRLSFFYIQDFSAILPGSTDPYFPFLKGFTLKGITTQYFDNKMFLEEGVGALLLNDRTFSDTDTWNYGTALSFGGGFDLRDFNLKGFKLGIVAEYGITFNNSLADYFTLSFQCHYLF